MSKRVHAMDKSEMKRSYKEAKRPMGVYRITIAALQRVYLGYSVDLTALLNRHRFELKLGTHRHKVLQQAWRTVGEAGVDFEVLDLLQPQESSKGDPADELPLLLEMWVEKLKAQGFVIETI